ncbi:ADP-ribosylglycohydrolase family protein [Rhodococcus sp. G-MC3]|uniref:ADP-ribosylglycohydrolase family protein n=1 Tax=Rhodococcus sp. G-MC3 TaxID=3046209 RepID=UPI0024BBE022|nr:ADP-ribosylglycohydrolase family protein [Rhodococcus sp. G-MC3]MDJ0396079.1 ADP-ribosylglycohydrolase family protein [Rhodococcus sp. G-MC3]
MALTPRQSDRAAGVLLGTAAGDALGAGYEFTHPTAGTVVDMIGGGPFDWAPGEWTDDTSMAAAVALAARGGVDIGVGAGLDSVAANFVAWYDTKPADIGNQTRAVLGFRSPSAAAMTAQAALLTGRAGGNGSLMRTAPVALAYLDDPQRCVDAAAAVSALTHSDPRAGEACQMWSFAIRHAVLEGNFDGVRSWLATSDAADFWRPLLDEAEEGEPADFANNGWVVHALQTSWWAIVRADGSGPEHLIRALELCVLAGGDTDTTAAIAGGLLGARWGASAVPQNWRDMLHGYPFLTGEGLVAIAAAITGGTS